MGMVWMKYWQECKSKALGTISYRYRRTVDASLKEHLKKGEIVIPLGKKAAAMKAYDKAHRDAEKMLRDAWDAVNGKGAPKVTTALTPREEFDEALKRARDLDVNPFKAADEDHKDYDPYPSYDDSHEADEVEWIKRDVLAEGIVAKYRPSYRAAGEAYAST